MGSAAWWRSLVDFSPAASPERAIAGVAAPATSLWSTSEKVGRSANVSSTERLTRGDTVGLRLDPAGVVVYADTTIAQLDAELTETTGFSPVSS